MPTTAELATCEQSLATTVVAAETLPHYTFRRLLPTDAAGVVDCLIRIYGDTYVHPEMYDANEIVRRNQTEQLVSVVTLDDSERVVGHYALERPELTAIAESGVALVLPEHRHHWLMESMRELLEIEAARLNLIGIWGHAVTNHLFTQRVVEKFGEHPTAVSLGWGSRAFHNMDESLVQRMSELLYFKYLQPACVARAAEIAVHLPQQHREICGRIYQQFDLRAQPGLPTPTPPLGQLNVELRNDLGRAIVRVPVIGAHTAAQIERTLSELQSRPPEHAVEAVFLELPLAQAGTPDLCDAAESRGFFFSGIGPAFAADGDVLRLQWLSEPIDPALIQIERPFAKELLAYIAAEQQRAMKVIR